MKKAIAFAFVPLALNVRFVLDEKLSCASVEPQIIINCCHGKTARPGRVSSFVCEKSIITESRSESKLETEAAENCKGNLEIETNFHPHRNKSESDGTFCTVIEFSKLITSLNYFNVNTRAWFNINILPLPTGKFVKLGERGQPSMFRLGEASAWDLMDGTRILGVNSLVS